MDQRKKPNILILLTDDQRYGTIHALGNEQIQTPNMDRLVHSGCAFTNAYIPGGTASAVCMPSRAMLNSGKTLFHLEECGRNIPPEHVTLGQCLLAIQAYLTGGGDDRETVTRELADTVSLLRNNTAEEHTDDKLYALNEAAKTVGVEIRIHGELPPQWKDVIEVAIHECLTNTVKHAGGRLLEVTVRQAKNAVTVELTNDGKPPKGPVIETGGLKNLRALVENRGGRMTVESEPAFRLVLEFEGEVPAARA